MDNIMPGIVKIDQLKMHFYIGKDGTCDTIWIRGRTISQLDWPEGTLQKYYQAAMRFGQSLSSDRWYEHHDGPLALVNTYVDVEPHELPQLLQELPEVYDTARERYINDIRSKVRMGCDRALWSKMASLTDNPSDMTAWLHYAENAYR